MLFQSSGRGEAEDNARPIFSPDSKSLLLGLLNGVSFVSEFFGECDKKSQNVRQNNDGGQFSMTAQG